jgi:hypothetical protein
MQGMQQQGLQQPMGTVQHRKEAPGTPNAQALAPAGQAAPSPGYYNQGPARGRQSLGGSMDMGGGWGAPQMQKHSVRGQSPAARQPLPQQAPPQQAQQPKMIANMSGSRLRMSLPG